VTEHSEASNELDALVREALGWVVRLRSGEATEADAEALERWRNQSEAHARAFREAVGLWRALGSAAREVAAEDPAAATKAGRGARRPPGHPVGRRALLAGALAASAAGYLIVWPPFEAWPSLKEMSADYRTAKGERRRVALADHVTLDLNTRTSVSVRSTRDQSLIELISGEAAITASLPPMSPLVVMAAGGSIRAAEAYFIARCDNGEASVTCISGRVDVDWAQRTVHLEHGQQVRYSAGGLGPSVPVDPVAATAWQSGLLIFHNLPLAEVIGEVNRYRSGRIIVANTELGRRLVDGVFHLDRLDDVVAQVRQAFGATVVSLPGGIVVLS